MGCKPYRSTGVGIRHPEGTQKVAGYYINNYENDKIKREIEEGERKVHLTADLADCIYP